MNKMNGPVRIGIGGPVGAAVVADALATRLSTVDRTLFVGYAAGPAVAVVGLDLGHTAAAGLAALQRLLPARTGGAARTLQALPSEQLTPFVFVGVWGLAGGGRVGTGPPAEHREK